MRNVRVIYSHEADGAWIGTSPDVPGFVGHGETYEEARDRVQDGLPWFMETENVLIAHIVPGRSEPRSAGTTASPKVSFGITRQPQTRVRYGHEVRNAQA